MGGPAPPIKLPVTALVKPRASRRLTTIRPPPISRLISAGDVLLARFASNLPEKCRIPERRKQNPAVAAPYSPRPSL